MSNKKVTFQLDNSEIYAKYLNAVQERKITAATTPTLNEGHNIHLALFEDTIYDYLRRDVSIYNWVPSVEATGQPTMWFEQTKNPANEQFSSPTTLAYKAIDDDYGRVPKSAMIKCITSKFSFPFFNTLVARQQGVLPDFVQKDIADWAWSFKRFVNKKLYYGTDTDLATPTTNEYMGIMTQLTNTVARAKTATAVSVLDVIEDVAANMESDVVNVTGTAADLVVFMNPKTRNMMVKQERERNSNFRMEKAELTPGFNIPGVDTAKGVLPIVSDPFIDVVTNAGNASYDHPILILNKRLIERRYVGAADPMVFDWNIGNDQLSTDKLAVLFDNVIVRGAAFGHVKVNYQVAQ